jgi:hypothetical protein
VYVIFRSRRLSRCSTWKERRLAQVRQIIAACNPKLPQEELAVRILVGAGLRESELCGLALVGSDGLPDPMLDSVQRGRVELRVRCQSESLGPSSCAVTSVARR